MAGKTNTLTIKNPQGETVYSFKLELGDKPPAGKLSAGFCVLTGGSFIIYVQLSPLISSNFNLENTSSLGLYVRWAWFYNVFKVVPSDFLPVFLLNLVQYSSNKTRKE